MVDLVIRGGNVVLPDGAAPVDLGIEDGRIAAVGAGLPGGREEIDARGFTVLPGAIDAHLHFNEPGRTEWEGAWTGSRGLAAGGGTLYFDMPLNSTPCTLDAASFEAKRAALAASSITDFGLWGGLVPGNLDRMEELASCGAIGFKAFLCDSGLPEFPRADDYTLYEGLRTAARLGLPVAVHAESQEITAGLTARLRAEGATSIRAWLDSRPAIAEVEAIQRACLLAREAGARLHIVHISSGRGVAAALEARARGADVSIETCAHYLFFTEEDLERLGAVAKCAPPLRSAAERENLWRHLLNGQVDIVASDHSPSAPELKQDADFFRIWGGIAGVQSTLAVLLEAGCHQRGLPLESVARLTATTPAERFALPRKGRIAEGCDADLVLVDVAGQSTLTMQDLHQRHRTSPYLGFTFRGRIHQTLRRGRLVYRDGVIMEAGPGQLVHPTPRKDLSRCNS